MKTIRRIKLRRGMLARPTDRTRLPTLVIEAADLSPALLEAVRRSGLLGVSGCFGDPMAGLPVQYDELTIERATGTDCIEVYNRAIMLFSSREPFYVRFHRLAHLIEEAAVGRRSPRKPAGAAEVTSGPVATPGGRGQGRKSGLPSGTNAAPRDHAVPEENGPGGVPDADEVRAWRLAKERPHKMSWMGTIEGVQPRIRLTRSFDERWHSYLGYLVLVSGEVGGVERKFAVAIGKVRQAEHGFRRGDIVQGAAWPVADAKRDTADLHRASALRVVARSGAPPPPAPPWFGVPPDLEVYRERGNRRLAARTYNHRCQGCQWGCRMPVEIIVDQWKATKRHRFETFCYGPKSCSMYAPGPTRKVPGRGGTTYVEEDWVDEDATAHRLSDE